MLRTTMPTLYSKLLFVQRLPKINPHMGDTSLFAPTRGNFTTARCLPRLPPHVTHAPLSAPPEDRRNNAVHRRKEKDYELKYVESNVRHDAALCLTQKRCEIYSSTMAHYAC